MKVAVPSFFISWRYLAVAAAIGLFLYAFYVTAWVTEDAFITFRVVRNFLNGYGLRWNIDERVQVFTHALWLLLLIPVYSLLQNAFLSALLLSLICCLVTLAVLGFGFSRNSTCWRFILLILLLVASRSFLDFTSSGLENPLSHLGATLFFVPFLYARSRPVSLTSAILLLLPVSLLFLNRHDTVLIALPAACYILLASYRELSRRKLPRLAMEPRSREKTGILNCDGYIRLFCAPTF